MKRHPWDGRQRRLPKAEKQRRQLQAQARRVQLANMGPFRLGRPPKTEEEWKQLRQAARFKARLEGKTGKALRDRAGEIVREAVAEAEAKVRAPLPGQHIVQRLPDDGMQRTPSGLIIIPGGSAKLITPP